MSLVEFAKNLVQFPFFTSTTHGCLQWVKLLSSVATSGIKGQLLMFVSSWWCYSLMMCQWWGDPRARMKSWFCN